MNNYAQLKTILEERLAALVADPKPTYTVDGQTVLWQQYTEMLQRSIDWCKAQIRDEEGPFEIRSSAVS